MLAIMWGNIVNSFKMAQLLWKTHRPFLTELITKIQNLSKIEFIIISGGNITFQKPKFEITLKMSMCFLMRQFCLNVFFLHSAVSSLDKQSHLTWLLQRNHFPSFRLFSCLPSTLFRFSNSLSHAQNERKHQGRVSSCLNIKDHFT